MGEGGGGAENCIKIRIFKIKYFKHMNIDSRSKEIAYSKKIIKNIFLDCYLLHFLTESYFFF